MRGRSRFVGFLLLPSAVCLWMIGWALFWIGVRREPLEKRKAVKGVRSRDLSFVVVAPEREILA